MATQPFYLGDAVYVQPDPEVPDRLVVTTESHEINQAGNVIYLEPEVALQLADYIKGFINKGKSNE